MREVLKKYLRNADNRCPDDYINTLKSKINLLKEAEKKYLKIPIAPTAPWPFPEQETSVTAGNTPQASQKD